MRGGGAAEDEGRPRRTRRRPVPRDQQPAHDSAGGPPPQLQPQQPHPAAERVPEPPPGRPGPSRRRAAPRRAADETATAPARAGHPAGPYPPEQAAMGHDNPGQEPPRPRGPRFGRPMSVGAIIGWTALSAFVPGAAHLRSGNRRLGFILLGVFGAILVGAIVYGLQFVGNVGAAIRESTLITLTVASIVLALAWFVLVLLSYITLGPDRLPQSGQIVSGIVVGVLCVSVMAPFALTATTVNTTQDFLDAFPSEHENPTAVPVKAEDPFNGRKRVNFLLIGGDAAGNRTGVRTDSMTVASVNIATGNTVLFSLPRNLQHVHFSARSPLNKQFPNGFHRELPNGGLLNEVWQYAEDNPSFGLRGPEALKDAIGTTLGLHIDYYAMVDMFGFAALIDAIGGLKIRVTEDVKYGGKFGTAGTIKAGYRVLNGEQVLWYGRSRVGSDDFSRMARQRCVIGALAQQASPAVVLANFTKIIQAAKRLFRTDIPRQLLEHLVDLGLKVKGAKITSTQFVPPQIWPGSPDWEKIKKMTATAIRKSVGTVPVVATASPSAPGASATPPSTTPTASASSSGLATPTPNKNTADQTLSELCGI
ncbi:hypothetical protein Aple_102180 [Acrocarpospora pleiomorpha]|uniref:Cell envelope-related transcriptional attenuator domain-containing protein n=1 Tax=Acrocarpospora pleiomorpha TaxID=90975 RepID=A0A5M3Y6T0_9ACTN|nr:LCP family protein [Acrocarpospora pleiomorpha]GES27318.1 hypothetical protein Aple_102180 [Acrocarpospora pleiomorpha]